MEQIRARGFAGIRLTHLESRLHLHQRAADAPTQRRPAGLGQPGSPGRTHRAGRKDSTAGTANPLREAQRPADRCASAECG